MIVPVYNVEKFLSRCIESVLLQSFSDFELLLIDDGSTDQSGKICDEYAEKDSRIIVLHQENKGQACARNTGIEYVLSKNTSEWICFIDSDDWVNASYIEGLYFAAVDMNCKISVCDFTKSESEMPSGIWESRRMTPSELYNQHFYIIQSPWCKLFHKSLFTGGKYRFPEGILYEDSAVIYKIMFSQKELAFTDRSLYYYYQRPNSSMNDQWNPKRMVYCKVQSDQLQWLINYGYEECVKTCLIHFLSSLHFYEHQINKIEKYKKYAREMRKTSRRLLRKYGKKYAISVKDYPQFYEVGYPRCMGLYWIIRARISILIKAR